MPKENGYSNLEDSHYKKFRKKLIDETSDDAEDYFSQDYENCGELFTDQYDATFPVGVAIEQVSNQSLKLEIPGFGRINTTIGELIRKIIVAGEETMNDRWTEHKAAIKNGSTGEIDIVHSEGAVQDQG